MKVLSKFALPVTLFAGLYLLISGNLFRKFILYQYALGGTIASRSRYALGATQFPAGTI
jgi:hypothetical protein